jgi:hypothetical protein
MHYYNAKSKVIMKGGGIEILSGEPDQDGFFGGGKRPFRKRTCRSKSRCGGAAARVHTLIPNVGFYVLN